MSIRDIKSKFAARAICSRQASECIPTAVILDLGVPVLSGEDVCREIRSESSSLPVIVLGARVDESDKRALLELGANDYVTKHFSPKKLLARVTTAIQPAQKES